MAPNKFGRYVWLVDLIRCHPYITFKEISDKWEDCGLGDGKPLPWKTFMNHLWHRINLVGMYGS